MKARIKELAKTNHVGMMQKRYEDLPDWIRLACEQEINRRAKIAARAVLEDMMQEQSDDVTARCYNEYSVAMIQCGLSGKTVTKVIKCLKEAVLPKLEEIRDEEGRDSNREEVLDADMWMKMMLEQANAPYVRFVENPNES